MFSSRDQPFEQKKIEKKDLSKKWMGLHGFTQHQLRAVHQEAARDYALKCLHQKSVSIPVIYLFEMGD